MLIWNRVVSRGIRTYTGIGLALFVLFVLVDYLQRGYSFDRATKTMSAKIAGMDEKLEHFRYFELERRKLLDRIGTLLNVSRSAFRAPDGDSIAESTSLNIDRASQTKLGAVLEAMDFSLPSVYANLPHITSRNAMMPAALVSAHRRGVYLAIGIPTVRRGRRNYLVETIRSLIHSMEEEERKYVLIVVLIAEQGLTNFASETIAQLQNTFGQYLREGLLELLVPSKEYYPPDIDTMEGTYGDPPERTRWRTKQNLDYMYLMSYCRSRGLYYMQLEDDLVTKLNFFSNIKFFVQKHSVDKWFMLEFSSLGFIAKLFRCRTLPQLIQFIAIFYRDKPVDWLLSRLLQVRFCGLDKKPKDCEKAIREHVFTFKPSLFQHVGLESSLKGKLQTLKEKDFAAAAASIQSLFKPHLNPPCRLNSTLKHYKTFTLENAYKGIGHFWAFAPVAGDRLTLEFTPSVNLSGFTFTSGSKDHPNDVFNGTIFEIQPSKADHALSAYSQSSSLDGYYIVAVAGNGTDRVNVSFEDIVPTRCLRLSFPVSCVNWLLISELWIRVQSAAQ
ncbi:hypothetical protein M514_06381 [Trichuris suis]|uniref:N-Acetylglucosaminyltransferase-IV region n=1 Tax=Trichuris suis TaxID=68888 RepID=A0A085NPW6_9BILA|nr:hypothetical protein M514_06381 [Trichuris suis]